MTRDDSLYVIADSEGYVYSRLEERGRVHAFSRTEAMDFLEHGLSDIKPSRYHLYRLGPQTSKGELR